MSRRKICVVTGARSEYGLLRWLMHEIQNDPGLILQVVATGMHLSPEFGLTYNVIENDGFTISAKVEMLLSSDSPVGMAKSIGLGILGFTDALERLKPDILVVLGDRYEILAAAQAAMALHIPVAHIHGGEITEGAIDDCIRHAVTKMSHIHFVANEIYRKRVVQLGEQPQKVFNFGAIGLDNIKKLNLLGKEEFEQSIGFTMGSLNFLVTYHPVTLQLTDPQQPVSALLEALDSFPQAKVIFTKPNSDAVGRTISRMIDQYVAERPERTAAFISLGQLMYLSAIRHVDVVIGNSSSGLIEVPAFKKPTVNIGDRQKGRLKASSVIDCPENKEDIILAINKALSQDFRQNLKHTISPYGEGDTSSRIVKVLKNIDLSSILTKRFYDYENYERE